MNSEGTITMITVWGALDLGARHSSSAVKSWDDCVDNCFNNPNCLLVTSDVSTPTKCVVYNYGDVRTVTEGSKEAGSKVSIKVTMKSAACFERVEELFAQGSNEFDSFISTSLFPSYKIDISGGKYTFSYISNEGTNKCNDWFELQPQCDDGCTQTMLFLLGSTIDRLSAAPTEGGAYMPTVVTATSWRECLMICWTTPSCFLAEMTLTEGKCSWFQSGKVSLIERENNKTKVFLRNNRVALKLNLGPNTCTLKMDTIFEDHYFKSPSGFDFSSFQISCSQHFIGVQWHENHSPVSVQNGQLMSGKHAYFMQQRSKTSCSEAAAICRAYGGGLLPIANAAELEKLRGTAYKTYNSVNLVVGLQKVGSEWTWSFPELVQDNSGIKWIDGYPMEGDDCAYLVSPGGLQSIRCSANLKDYAYACYVPIIGVE